MSIQEEIEKNIKKMNQKLKESKELSIEDIETLLLSSFIEEEGKK